MNEVKDNPNEVKDNPGKSRIELAAFDLPA